MRPTITNALKSTNIFNPTLKLWQRLCLINILITLNTWAPLVLSQDRSIGFITDKLTVGMHENPNRNSAILKVVPSNSQLFILKTENDFFLVEDEAKNQGWIEKSFVTKKVPVEITLIALQEENKSLTKEVDSLQSRLGMGTLQYGTDQKLLKENTSLKGKLSQQKLKTGQLKAEIAELKINLKSKSIPPSTKIIELERNLSNMEKEARNAHEIMRELEARVSDEPSLTLVWVGLREYSWAMSIVILVACLAMFALGFWTCDGLARRRHGGFRL